MKKFLGIGLAVIVMISLVSPALASSTVYTDRTNWENAVGDWTIEDFTDATLNTEISVETDQGLVTGGLWWDQLDDGDWPPGGETTWTFAVPIIAWGATFDAYNPGGPGSSIRVTYLDGTETEVGIIPNTINGAFWGFVADEPFTKVHLVDADLIEGRETYEMDDMVYTELEVGIDIKPWSDPNAVNRKQHGVIPVGILGTDLLDVTIFNGATFEFLGATATAHDLTDPATFTDHIVQPHEQDPIGNPGYFVTANDDLIPDLVIHFNEDDLTDVGYVDAAKGGEIAATLTITLANGIVIVTESDTIVIKN